MAPFEGEALGQLVVRMLARLEVRAWVPTAVVVEAQQAVQALPQTAVVAVASMVAEAMQRRLIQAARVDHASATGHGRGRGQGVDAAY